MREPGLAEAIRAAGGISELARQIGISQPSVSNWIRVPAERVVSVEAVTGIDRRCCGRTSTAEKNWPTTLMRLMSRAPRNMRSWPRF